MIAALFVQTNGVYFNVEGVDPWDIKRDAMRYEGPHTVVAHPPCARWCRLAGLVESRYGHKRGDDGGTFAFALECVRRFGGVLEHPAWSDAWAAYGLPVPPRGGGWTRSIWCGGATCEVLQSSYGHRARKPTWLYAHGVELPSLLWGERVPATATIGSYKHHRNRTPQRFPTLYKAAASRTPLPFRDALLSIARSGRRAATGAEAAQGPQDLVADTHEEGAHRDAEARLPVLARLEHLDPSRAVRG